jgi:hypothetical protein
MTHLSFRIAQEYHPERQQSREPLLFRVIVASNGERAVEIVDYGALHFPVVVPDLTIAQTNQTVDATKNALRTYRIPLSDFGLDLGATIQGITFDFSDTGSVEGERIEMALDQLQLTR